VKKAHPSQTCRHYWLAAEAEIHRLSIDLAHEEALHEATERERLRLSACGVEMIIARRQRDALREALAESLVYLRALRSRLPRLDWTGACCCPACDGSEKECRLVRLIAQAEEVLK
jgi:hypothetical protein